MRTTTNVIPSSRPTGGWLSALSSLWARLGATGVGSAARGLSRQAMNGRVLYRLSLLTDHELSDIGLSRYDVAAAALPENGDATHYLVARRDERQRLRHGSSPF